MSKKTVYAMAWTVLVIINYGWLSASLVLADDAVDKSNEQTKHIHVPFVHIDVTRHKDGTKDVDVRAPFTKVHNPAGPNNAEVKAPFTKVDHTNNNTGTDKNPVIKNDKS